MKLPFAKVLPFSLTTVMRWVPEYLEVLLGQLPYKEIRAEQTRSSGFVPAIDGKTLVEPIGTGAVYIRFKHTEKPIPKAYVNKMVQQRIDEIRADEEREVRRPERMEITEKIVMELIPHLVPKDTFVNALLTPTHIFIDSGSHARAEDLLSSLRAAIGTLPVQVLTTASEPTGLMTNMMLGRIEDPLFKLGERFKAKATSGKSVVSGTHLHLDQTALQELVDDGRQVVELELCYSRPHSDGGSDLWFVLGKDQNLKGIVWPPELSDMVSAEVGEDLETETIMRASLMILLNELEQLFTHLTDLMGGEIFGASEGRKPEEQTLLRALGDLSSKVRGTGAESVLLDDPAVQRAFEYAAGDHPLREYLNEHGAELVPQKPPPEQPAKPEIDDSDIEDLI